jgi:hypothetical protein
MEVPTRGVYLVHYVNRPADHCHAVTAMLSSRGSTSSSPWIWCNTRQIHYGTRLCPVCERYCCQHLALSGIAPELLETKQIPLVDLAAQPVHLRETVKVSNGANQPRRQKKADAIQKAATVQAKRSRSAPPPSNHTVPPRPQPTTGTSQSRGLVDASSPVQPHASAWAGPPFSCLSQNPLDTKQAVHVHPEVCCLGRFCFVWNCKSQVCCVVTTIERNVNAKGCICRCNYIIGGAALGKPAPQWLHWHKLSSRAGGWALLNPGFSTLVTRAVNQSTVVAVNVRTIFSGEGSIWSPLAACASAPQGPHNRIHSPVWALGSVLRTFCCRQGWP